MKIVLITGISRGIGEALAKKFLSKGYFVIGTSTKGTANINDKNLITLKLNLTDPKSVKNCAKKVLKLKKKIDILINNAGTIWTEKENNNEYKINMKILRKTLETNLIGPIDFTLQIIPIINLGGHIVNISSRQGSLNYVYEMKNPSYQISKAGLNMFTRTLSFQLENKITVSSVHPGAVLTRLAASDANMSPEEAAEYIYNTAISKPKTGQFWFKGKTFPW